MMNFFFLNASLIILGYAASFTLTEFKWRDTTLNKMVQVNVVLIECFKPTLLRKY